MSASVVMLWGTISCSVPSDANLVAVINRPAPNLPAGSSADTPDVRANSMTAPTSSEARSGGGEA